MGSHNLVLIIFIYLRCLSNLLITLQYTSAQQDVTQLCSGENYTTGSMFEANLNLLFPSIITDRYYNATVGQSPDTVYGSVQCRGDATVDACQSCIQMGAQEIIDKDRCRNSKQAIILYDRCMLRYSDQYYFNIMEDAPEVCMANLTNVSNPEQFFPVLVDLMNDLVREAASTFSNNFASGDKYITNDRKLYGFVECAADIPSRNCITCLLGARSRISNCCDDKIGGRIVSPSCNIRYEIYPFLQSMKNAPSPAPLASLSPSSRKVKSIFKPSMLVIIIVVLSFIMVLSACAFRFFCFWRKKNSTENFGVLDGEIGSTESLHFNFSVLNTATNNFSDVNKLGEGGFGSVYKGTLSDGQEIAVKRLSKTSRQGEQEFKNEVILVAKLQHRNLVKLVGFSLAGEEKLLIYEFMPNASLDQFLFDPNRCTQLDWERRYKIIRGIARGLLYLHEESRLKIIHRDLKASNILLDMDMNPKIADFGMARLFGVDQTQASTNRIVGTHGYMAPEYIMYGEFSVGSDVFSFGVLVLEIVSGKRNSSFHRTDIARDLLSYAWKHWKNGSAVELLDPTLKGTCSTIEVMICIHVGLLCVQENVADRPTMATVVQMLSNSVISHDLPSSPAFFADSTRHIDPHPTLSLSYNVEQRITNDRSSTYAANWSVNEASFTELYPR